MNAYDDLYAFNAERLLQWAQRLAEAEASALVLVGIRLQAEPSEVTVLMPDRTDKADVIRLLKHAANMVALQEAVN